MARGFVNLNRYKHGRALKRNSKRRTEPRSKIKITRRDAKFRAQDK